MDSPIGKKLFHLVVNPGVVPVTRRDTKMAAELVILLQILDELVDEEVEILFGFDEEEDINVVAATSTFNSWNNPEQTTPRYINRSETDLITSELAMNHAKTWHRTGITLQELVVCQSGFLAECFL